jgi:hypothetical protein
MKTLTDASSFTKNHKKKQQKLFNLAQHVEPSARHHHLLFRRQGDHSALRELWKLYGQFLTG